VKREEHRDIHAKTVAEKFGQYTRNKIVTLIAKIIVESAIRKYEQQKSNPVSAHLNRPPK
jgi:hypothetical protein